MKKYYYILATLVVSLVACNKENPNGKSSKYEESLGNGKKYIEIAISQEKPIDSDTKATLSTVNMAFGPEDQIAILATKNETTEVVTLTYLRYDDDNDKVIFSGTADEDALISSYAYYPASIATTTERTINWPTSVNGSKVQVPMIAYLDKDAGSARFQHLGAIAKIAVGNCPAGAAKLKFTAGTNITGGAYTVSDFTTGTPMVTASGEMTGATITATISGNGIYYIPLPVNTTDGTSFSNFQFALINGTGDYYYKQKTATKTVGPVLRRNIVNFGTLTYDVDDIEEWYLVSAVNNWKPNNRDLRYIKVSETDYRIATWSNAGGYKVVEGHNTTAEGDWSNSYGSNHEGYWAATLVKGSSTNCSYNVDNNIMTSTITPSTKSYNATNNSWGDTFYCYGKIALKWDGVEYEMSTASTHCHNWVLSSLTVSSNSEYRFSISHWKDDKTTRDKYRTNSSLHITDSTPYGKLNEVESVGENSCYAVLTQGTYTVYYNDAQGDIMFVKAAPSL